MTDQSDICTIPTHLQDLPDEVFRIVSTYLTDTSRINLALSKLCSKFQALKILPKHILHSIRHKKRLDTGDLYPENWENEEPTELNDDDIATLLSIINAKKTVRVLILSQTNITGVGLEPLRNSTKLKLISFSDSYKTELSEDAVVPILRSMLPPNVEKSSLLHVENFPLAWTGKKKKANFAEFLSIFDAELKRRKYCCKDCGKRCTPYHDCEDNENESGSEDETDSVDDSDYNFICQDTGKTRYICEKCRSFCCHEDDEYACENARKECSQCSTLICGGCRDSCAFCEDENGDNCQDCMLKCDDCGVSCCRICYHYCGMNLCSNILCPDCGDCCEGCNEEAQGMYGYEEMYGYDEAFPF